MIIRNMTIGDYDEVYALWLSVPGVGLHDPDDSREGIDKYLRRNPATSFVAEESGTIVGAIMAGHDGRRGYISHTAVSPSRQGTGIGKRLAEAALEALRREGITKAALVAFRDNDRGNAFWEHLGFSERADLFYRQKWT